VVALIRKYCLMRIVIVLSGRGIMVITKRFIIIYFSMATVSVISASAIAMSVVWKLEMSDFMDQVLCTLMLLPWLVVLFTFAHNFIREIWDD
jgi:hypothetical protein